MNHKQFLLTEDILESLQEIDSGDSFHEFIYIIIPPVANVKASMKLVQHRVSTTERTDIAMKVLIMPSYREVQDHGSCRPNKTKCNADLLK
jgi:hypothetical protein